GLRSPSRAPRRGSQGNACIAPVWPARSATARRARLRENGRDRRSTSPSFPARHRRDPTTARTPARNRGRPPSPAQGRSRRAAAAASLLPPAGRAEAQTGPDGNAPFQLSKRNVVNVNDISFILNDYGFIDHIRQGPGIMSPFGGGPPFATGTPWNTLLDAD